jgi:hypothetical protein
MWRGLGFPITNRLADWAGFIEPNIGDGVDADVGQTMKLFTNGLLLHADG